MWDFYLFRNPQGDDVGLLGFGDQNFEAWSIGSHVGWALRVGYVVGMLGGDPEHVEAVAARQDLRVADPVSLPWNPDQREQYPEIVREHVATIEALAKPAADSQSAPDLLEEEARVDSKGPLLARINVAYEGLSELKRRGWGDPVALGRVIFDTDGAFETLSRELEISADSEIMRTVKAACGTLFEGVQQLKTEGPESAEANQTLSQGIGALERAAALLA